MLRSRAVKASFWGSGRCRSAQRCRRCGAIARRCRQAPGRGVGHDGRVLADADRSLAEWLGTVLPRGTEVRFDAPGPRWADRPAGPLVVGVLLHAVRQDSAGRHSAWTDVRGADGLVVGRQPPVRHFRLSYLLTAWASAGADVDGLGRSAQTIAEHEALGQILSACAQTETLPAECMKGVLAESGLPTALLCAPAESAESAGDVRSGLGVGPRACLQLVLIAPYRPPVVTELAPPAREIVLNAGQESSDPGGGAGTTRRPGTLNTVRRWERQTRNEISASPRRVGQVDAEAQTSADAVKGRPAPELDGYTGA